MEEVMFNLFERQSHWTLRNLIQDTDQPEVNLIKGKTLLYSAWLRDFKREHIQKLRFVLFNEMCNGIECDLVQQFLKDLLRDLCIYNNKGSNQGTYELKPEYKRSTQE